MSKRKVQFAEPMKPESGTKRKKAEHFRKKPKELDKNERDAIDYNDDLGDSGSEGEGEGSNVLDMDEIEVEEKTVEFDQEVKITPFNLDEEMEEGHFDKDGTFVFSKESNIRDSWLDEFDFNNVRQLESARMAEEKRKAKRELEDSELANEELTQCAIYQQIVTFLSPGESVLKAVRRLGNATKSLSASERLKLKKLAAKQASSGGAFSVEPKANVEEQKKQLARLTELADVLIRRGHMNAYEETYEALEFQIKLLNKPPAASVVSAPASDMFADEFAEAPTTTTTASTSDNKPSSTTDDDVKWEYKLSVEDDSALRGPVSTQALMDIIAEKPSSYYVRRHGTLGHFYSADRIDFSLYID